MLKNLKKIKKLFVKNSIIENINEEILDYKDIGKLLLTFFEGNTENIKNFILQVKNNPELKNKLIEQLKNINKTQILSYVEEKINNYYISYFSIYLLMFILFEIFDENKEKIFEFFINDYEIAIPSDFQIKKEIIVKINHLFNLSLKQNITFYQLLIEMLLKNNLLDFFFKTKLIEDFLNKDIIKIENAEFLQLIVSHPLFFENSDKFFSVYIKLGIENKIILTKFNKEYYKNFINYILGFIKHNNRTIIEIILEKKYKEVTEIIKNYSNTINDEKKLYLNELMLLNKELFNKKINYRQQEIKKLEEEVKCIKSEKKFTCAVDKAKLLQKIKMEKRKLRKFQKLQIFNFDYYFFILLLLNVEKTNFYKLIPYLKYNNLINIFIDLKINNLIKEIIFIFSNANIKKYKNFVKILLEKSLKEINTSYKDYLNNFTSLEKNTQIEIFKFLYQNAFYIFNENKLLNEINKSTECQSCAKDAIKIFKFNLLKEYQPFFYSRIKEKNKKIIEKLINHN